MRIFKYFFKYNFVKMKFKGTLFINFVLFSLSLGTARNNFQLELLQVIFRHGDRTPDKVEIYPTDPHEPHEYEKYGYGQLTQIGAVRMENFGQVLRTKYDDFLGEYQPNEVYSYSTDFNRTKLSLQAVLRGLYPPNKKDSSLVIPLHRENLQKSFLRNPFFFDPSNCPRYFELRKKYGDSSEMKSRLDAIEHGKLEAYIQNFTGPNLPLIKFYNNMKAVIGMNLSPPKWVTEEILVKLGKFVDNLYNRFTFDDEMKRISAGRIIKKVLDNIEDSNANKDGGKKIYLYGGHDLNVKPFITAHSFSEALGPAEFGSAVIIEKLRKKSDDQVYLRMFYWTGVGEKMIPLTFKNVGNEIPLDIYQQRVKNLLPRISDCN